MLTAYFNKVIKAWFGGESERPFVEYAIKELEENWDRKNVFVIEAPTGYGKSTISATVALYSVNEELKSIIAFPLRALLEDQYNKFKGLVGENMLGKRYMHNPGSRYLIKPITLTTVDTLSMTLFGIPPEDMDKVVRAWDGTSTGSLGHYLFSWASVALSNIVLDEVHLLADSTKSLSFLIALMRICMDFDQKLILMSATIPNSLKDIIKEHIPSIKFIEYEPDADPGFYEGRLSKSYDIILEEIRDVRDKYKLILKWIDEHREFSRVITVFNTVTDAIKFYELVKDRGNVLLLHSRFSERDREKKSQELQVIKNEDKYIIVSTQVIEAGIDISSNLFITEIAPANSLIQRLGRFLRYDEKAGRVIIWYEGKEGKIEERGGKYKVYDSLLTQRTLDWLTENSDVRDGRTIVNLNVHLPEARPKRGFKELLNYVYDKDSFGVSVELVRDFEKIFLHLEDASLKAVSTFFKMEGSFVRDSLLVPVVLSDLIKEQRRLRPIEFVKAYIIPISFETFKEKGNYVIGTVIEEDDEIIYRELDERLSNKLRSGRLKPQDILRCILEEDVLAFAIKGKYDGELGLRFDYA